MSPKRKAGAKVGPARILWFHRARATWGRRRAAGLSYALWAGEEVPKEEKPKKSSDCPSPASDQVSVSVKI